MPKRIRQVGLAKQEFPAHTRGMLQSEREKPSEKVNMLSMLVRESDGLAKTTTASIEKQGSTVEGHGDAKGEGEGEKETKQQA